MGRGVNVGSNIWVQILALPHTDCGLGPLAELRFFCVWKTGTVLLLLLLTLEEFL